MSQRDIINQLLEDMDIIRPIVITAMPDDPELRSRTRRMITELEFIRNSDSVPASTYSWLSGLTSKLLDAEHGTLLKPSLNGIVPEQVRQSVREHIEQRQMLLMQAVLDIPATLQLLDQSSEMVGRKARTEESLQGRARHLQKLLSDHLQHDAALRKELQQLIDAINNSFSAISDVLQWAGEDSPELQQARILLEQELPEDIEEARKALQNARQSILNANNKLVTASTKLQDTMQQHVEQLSTLSSQLERAESEARNDPLTGLANRRRLAELLDGMVQSNYTFLIVDIDFFKKINDDHGHDVGDEILVQLAVTLSECIRATDFSARIGGEEFCIIFPDTDLDVSAKLAETLRHSIEMHPFKTKSGRVDVTVSIGVAQHVAGTAQEKTFKAADRALYQSKNNGRNRVSTSE